MQLIIRCVYVMCVMCDCRRLECALGVFRALHSYPDGLYLYANLYLTKHYGFDYIFVNNVGL